MKKSKLIYKCRGIIARITTNPAQHDEAATYMTGSGNPGLLPHPLYPITPTLENANMILIFSGSLHQRNNN